jgi:phosphoenolpyruvate carboxylase
MTKSPIKDLSQFQIRNPLPVHFEQIQDLCKRVYPFTKPWSLAQLESHRSYFPDGQLIVVDKSTKKVVGIAFSLIINWNDYSPQDNWQDFTAGGFFHNHDPQNGKTLYGAEIMVDPEYRGRGIGKLLYAGRELIVEKYNLQRIRAGARLRGYSKYHEKMNPQQYVAQVVLKKIYDPTLSFQLNKGFKVIDAAPNYLFNDPESLGFAAVIEWLNPKTNAEADYDKQNEAIKVFLDNEKYVSQHLHRDLRRLVRKTTTLLGQIILETEGEEFYKKVESYRSQLKATRMKSESTTLKINSLLKRIERENKKDQLKLAHAFALQLEMVNLSEAAYRTWRQKHKATPPSSKHKLNLTYVLTAHPTEARSRTTINVLGTLLNMLIDGAYDNFVFNEIGMKTKLRILWSNSLSKKKSPTVVDEAEYIFSIIFNPEIFDFIISEKPTYDLKLRTWVGGDKDGHPGVNKDVMKECLEGSRNHIIDIIDRKLDTILVDITLLGLSENYHSSLLLLKKDLRKISKISTGDGTKIKTWFKKFSALIKKTNKFIQHHEQILNVQRIFELFPALVLPIELREDASLIADAISDMNSPIRNMLTELNKISGAMNITHYARGLVISHCEETQDVETAQKLILQICSTRILPIIPLFESKEALVNSSTIIKKWLNSAQNKETVLRLWNNKFEVMLGYSDSSKQIGPLSSRLMINKTMYSVEKTLHTHGITPIFFHGSGGSVARGGGSIQEQISWWSQSAIENPKVTIQGEMIHRQFTSKEILNSQCIHMSNEALKRRFSRVKTPKSPELSLFAQHVESEYTRLVKNGSLLDSLLSGTPYQYLDALKIGSRPSKRKKDQTFSLESLRAIPWVLCWTQARILLPTWWGVGSSWKKLSSKEKEALKKLFQKNPFFSSYVKTIGFTLAKVDMDIWKLYLNDDKIHMKIMNEYKLSVNFIMDVSQKTNLISHKPWLEESIRLRSPHINILNLLQIQAMKNSDEALLKETIVGIASGMLTTG